MRTAVIVSVLISFIALGLNIYLNMTRYQANQSTKLQVHCDHTEELTNE
jgi:hypothetical protein